MKILVDMDDVLADFIGGFEEELINKGVEPISRKDRIHYDFGNYETRISSELRGVCMTAGFFKNLLPIEGAIESMKAIKDAGHDVYICTTPFEDNLDICKWEKEGWVYRHLGSWWVDRISFADNGDKTGYLGDILLDDKPELTGKITPSWEHVIYDQPWNRYVKNGQRRFSWGMGLDKLLKSIRD